MPAVDLLQELLRCDTRNPPGHEETAVRVLDAYLSRAGLETETLTSPEGRANFIARLPGSSSRPALVLLSHMDVVPVEEDEWTHPPFSGEIHDGAIWGRGALDMKGVAVMHTEALAALAASGTKTSREVILCSVADEEEGGKQGVQWLLEEHADKVGFGKRRPPPEVLGEGGFGLSEIVERPLMPIVLGEKSALRVEVTATGDPGHGSLPPANMATKNLSWFINKIAGHQAPRVHPVMREQFRDLAEAASGAKARVFQVLGSGGGTAVARALAKPLRAQGAVAALLSDTISPTRMDAGYAGNVVPGVATATLDCRLLPDTDPDEFLAGLQKTGADRGVRVRALMRTGGGVSNKGTLYNALERASQALPNNPVVTSSLSPGITDVRFFRERGAKGYGWVPVILSPELLGTIHGHNERIPVEALEQGVAAMTDAVETVATEG